MINRVLIRIKVVQLLYSYLLIENPFALESQPSAPTKEKRFAYNLYLDLLDLMTRLANRVEFRGLGKPLLDSRFIRNVLADDKIRALQANRESVPFVALEDELAGKIKESGIFKQFVKDIQNDETPDENVWKEIFANILIPDQLLNAEIARRENYTMKGVERMSDMMETTFANFFASADHISDALKILEFSLNKSRELYFRLLTLPIALTDLREQEIDSNRHKLLRTAEDINPNMRFVDNEYVKALRYNTEIDFYSKKYGISWLEEDRDMIAGLLKRIMQSEIYTDYMSFPATTYKSDCEFWKNVYRNIIFSDTDFMEHLEDKSVFWNDDLDIIGTFVIKTLKRYENAGEEVADAENLILPMFKDEEDARFGAELFSYVIKRKDYLRGLITEAVDESQWETDRLAFMDVVIIMTALAEILEFPKIPLTVSFNEYIEIAKTYSTPKSGVFINGLLGEIVNRLREMKIIVKQF